MAGNTNLARANKEKNDEFYTRLTDIEKELRHYWKHFEGKTILCNCDDPFESNFFKYFVLNFNKLKLKKLITTCYTNSPIANQQLSLFDIIEANKTNTPITELYKVTTPSDKAYMAEVTKVYDTTGDGGIDMLDVKELFRLGENKITELKGDGDFRSKECIDLLKKADIVITNPPFSLFREYVATLMEHDKKFIIWGNTNAVTYKEIFPLIKEGKIWGGFLFNKTCIFQLPDHYAKYDEKATKEINDGKRYGKVPSIATYTNLDIKKRHEDIILVKKYKGHEEDYPKYDNYDAIEVSRVKDIPYDYDGIMGVPITFLDKYNPEQFEILGMTLGRKEFDKEAWPTKRYINAIQHNKNGTTTSGSKANTGPIVLLESKPNGIYYTADNADGPLLLLYARILIRNKQPEI